MFPYFVASSLLGLLITLCYATPSAFFSKYAWQEKTDFTLIARQYMKHGPFLLFEKVVICCRHQYCPEKYCYSVPFPVSWWSLKCISSIYWSTYIWLLIYTSLFLCQNGGEFLIQANIQKRQKVEEDCSSPVVDHAEVNTVSFSSIQPSPDLTYPGLISY